MPTKIQVKDIGNDERHATGTNVRITCFCLTTNNTPPLTLFCFLQKKSQPLNITILS